MSSAPSASLSPTQAANGTAGVINDPPVGQAPPPAYTTGPVLSTATEVKKPTCSHLNCKSNDVWIVVKCASEHDHTCVNGGIYFCERHSRGIERAVIEAAKGKEDAPDWRFYMLGR